MFTAKALKSKWTLILLLAALAGAAYFLILPGLSHTSAFNFGRESSSGLTSYTSYLTGGIDRWSFFGSAPNALLLVDVDVEVYGSKLDPVIRILDSTGKVLANNDDDFMSLDSSVGVVLPTTGYYTVEITDFNGSQGGPAYFYLLNISSRTCTLK